MKQSIEETLQEAGFEKKRICHCGGFETAIYKKGEWEIRWQIHGKKFSIKNDRRIVHGWDKIQNFPIEFKKHVAL